MAQVYPRISNPFMPQGLPSLTNAPTPFYAPGEIGGSFNDQSSGGSWLRVLLDSGATSSTPVGAVQAGQLAFWKDRANNIVTNDPNFNDTGTPANCVNRVAGVFATAVTAAPGVNNTNGVPVQYVCDLVIQHVSYPVAATAATVGPGLQAIADGTTGRAKGLATVTTAPTQQVLGVWRSSDVVAGLANMDVNIGFVD